MNAFFIYLSCINPKILLPLHLNMCTDILYTQKTTVN